LVNDASPEDDRESRRTFRGHRKLSWYRNRSNLGPFASINAIAAFLRTPYLAVQDADDIALSNRLWRALHAMKVAECDLYGASMEQFKDARFAKDPVHDQWLDSQPVLRSGRPMPWSPFCHLVNATMVCRRDAFERLNGFANYHCGADSEFVVRAHLSGLSMFIDQSVVGLRRLHDRSLSRCGAYAIGSDYHRAVGAGIGKVVSHVREFGERADVSRFGAMNRQSNSSNTIVVVGPGEVSDRQPKAFQLASLSRDSVALDYLSEQGLVGIDAPLTPAVLRLDRFTGPAEFLGTLSKSVIGSLRRADARGMVCREFDPRAFPNDIRQIIKSRPVRQGRPMRDTVSAVLSSWEGDDSVDGVRPATDCSDRSHWRWVGVFHPDSRSQDAAGTQWGRLVAFSTVHRKGEVAYYSRFLGDGDFLRDGVMIALHVHNVNWGLRRDDPATAGLRYLLYSSWQDGESGLRWWKQRAGFRPHRFHLLPRNPAHNEALTRPKTTAFPTAVLDGATSAAAFYCAAFGGRNDVAHYHRAGLPEVALVDRDGDQMARLQAAFPDEWDYHVGDAVEVAEQFASVDARTFDVVSCDHWSSQFEWVAGKQLRTFYQLCNRHLLLTLVPRWADALGHDREWFVEQGMDHDFYRRVRDAAVGSDCVNRLSDVLTEQSGFPVRVSDLVRRSDYLDGCFWVMIDAGAQP
jgi:hypothetical protein